VSRPTGILDHEPNGTLAQLPSERVPKCHHTQYLGRWYGASQDGTVRARGQSATQFVNLWDPAYTRGRVLPEPNVAHRRRVLALADELPPRAQRPHRIRSL